MSDSLRPHEPQHARPPCPSPTPESTQTHTHGVGFSGEPQVIHSPSAKDYQEHTSCEESCRWRHYSAKYLSQLGLCNTIDWVLKQQTFPSHGTENWTPETRVSVPGPSPWHVGSCLLPGASPGPPFVCLLSFPLLTRTLVYWIKVHPRDLILP